MGFPLLIDEQQVLLLMESSTSEPDWNINCDSVKRDNGGEYPDFWFRVILQSGVSARVQKSWK